MRKKRKGAFWEDRYHATAIQSEQHLLRCLVYIDLDMVRAGVVSHPSEWQFGGYNEIKKPRRKCALIAYTKLAELSGFANYDTFIISHYEFVTEALYDDNCRQAWWCESIAVGDEPKIKQRLRFRAKSRKIESVGDGFQFREELNTYIADFELKNSDIGLYNTFLIEINNDKAAS